MDGQKEKEKTKEKEKVKPEFDGVIFDLDGTLWNTVPLCTVAWNEIIAQMAIARSPLTKEDMASIMGMTAEELKEALFPGIDKKLVDLLVEKSFARETEMLRIDGAQLYEGVREGLAQLARRYKLFLVSNCQLPYLEAFFSWSGFSNLFADSECIGRTGKPKGHNIRAVVERNGLKEPVYIGDTRGDEKAAEEASVPFIYASYGFGEAQKPYRQFASFPELVEYLTP